LTIKLTQRDPIQLGSPGNRLEGSCKPYQPLSQGVVPHPVPNNGSDRHTARGASSPFHIALLSSKTCGFPRHANLDIRATRCQLLSVVKELVPFTASDRNVSAPGGAPQRFGAAATIQKALQIKKPGVERRACPSIRFGCCLPAQPPGRICSKLVVLVPGVRNQPHLYLVRQTRSVRRIPG